MCRTLSVSAIVLSILLLTVSGPTVAQSPEEVQQSLWNLEALPPALAIRVERQEQALEQAGLGKLPRGVYSRLKLWPLETSTLRVCFFSGPQDVRERIAAYAQIWTALDTRLSLDFGDDEDPRLCGSDDEINHIRIGFDQPGYWSFIGQDSLYVATQLESSMNLSGFDTRSVAEAEFRRVVLHEFGHAFGLKHEHQNEYGNCEAEFDFDRIYEYLTGPPNNWTTATVDRNLRALHERGTESTALDVSSIMMYSFPADYYLKGPDSVCFAQYNTELSAADETIIADIYPTDPDEAAADYQATRDEIIAAAEGAEGDATAKATTLGLLNLYLPAVK